MNRKSTQVIISKLTDIEFTWIFQHATSSELREVLWHRIKITWHPIDLRLRCVLIASTWDIVAVATGLPNLDAHVTWPGPDLDSFPVHIQHHLHHHHQHYLCLTFPSCWVPPRVPHCGDETVIRTTPSCLSADRIQRDPNRVNREKLPYK